jgi:putative MATE family efflux protein
MAATGFVSALIGGVLLAVAGSVFMEPLARLLGATDAILPRSLAYMRFILIGAPWMSASLTLNNLLRYQGNAFYGMIGMVSGAVVNIGLDPLLIFVFNMGVGGAALATMLSQFVSFCLLLFGCSRKGNIQIHLRNFSPSAARYKEILRGGLPSLCRQGLAGVATIGLNQFAGGFSVAAIAAVSIVQRTMMFAASALIGFGQGFQPVCGFNYGAKLYSRVRKAFWFCVKLGTAILVVLSVFGFLFAPQIMAVFRKDDAEVIRIGVLAMRLQCSVFPLLAWVTMQNMMMQTMGKAGRASILATARQGLFLLPMLFLLVPAFGLIGLQISPPIADFGTFLLSLPLGFSVLRELKRPDAPRQGGE